MEKRGGMWRPGPTIDTEIIAAGGLNHGTVVLQTHNTETRQIVQEDGVIHSCGEPFVAKPRVTGKAVPVTAEAGSANK